MTIQRQALNYIKHGRCGDQIENNGRKIVRISSGVIPDCMMYENGEPVGIDNIYDAVEFLLGGTE